MIIRHHISYIILVLILILTPALAFAARYREDERNAVDREANFRFGRSRSMRNAVNQLDDDSVENLYIPVLLDVAPTHIYDSWGDPRGPNGERKHEGNDILATRGAFIVSPTEAVVGATGFGQNGGNYVYTFNPGKERFYYAHLDALAKDLKPGDILKPGDFIGYVGTTGNAEGGIPHLHFGIYRRGAQNPYPRLTKEFSLKERMEILTNILESEDNVNTLVQRLVKTNRALFKEAEAQGVEIPNNVASIFDGERAVASLFTRNLDVGSIGTEVLLLQKLLNTKGFTVAVSGPGSPGNETEYFGKATQSALIRFQQIHGVEPAVGYFGPLTREKLAEV